MEYAEVEVDLLVYDPQNPRKHNEQNYAAIRDSIEDHGQVEPLIVQKTTQMVIAGNARLKVLKELGYETTNIVYLDVSDEVARKLSIRLNRSGELSGWDEAMLAHHLEELAKLADFDPTMLGFTGSEMDDLINSFGGIDDSLDFFAPPDEKYSGNDANAGAGGRTENSTVTNVWDSGDEDAIAEDVITIDNPTISTSRMIQLIFENEKCQKFKMACKSLSYAYDTDNMPDTVYEAVMAEYKRLGGDDNENNEDSGKVESIG
ncbi:MAG TPA: hypothetical protein EYN67_06775 [Flavobacteriales bacterium]|nr:hypothetical protein [Flavobacteriales bacterium]